MATSATAPAPRPESTGVVYLTLHPDTYQALPDDTKARIGAIGYLTTLTNVGQYQWIVRPNEFLQLVTLVSAFIPHRIPFYLNAPYAKQTKVPSLTAELTAP